MLLTRRYPFSASHRLHADRLSAEENAALFGKCNNPFGHGHNYVLAVTVEGAADHATGRVLNVGALDRFVRESVLSSLDHRDLNCDVPEFGSLVPTTENLASVIDQRLRPEWPRVFPGTSLHAISIQETKRNSFELKNS